MLAIIGSLVGFFSGLIPEVLNFVKDRKDKDHEVRLLNLQIEASKIGHNGKLEELQIKADNDEIKSLYNYSNKPSKVLWVEALSSSVRPVLTYAFFLLYAAVKVIAILHAGEAAAAESIWTEEDQGIFFAVIGFWFGHRAFSKNRLTSHLYSHKHSNGNGNGHFGIY